MEKRIELERRGLPPNKVKELVLDNCRGATIEGLTDEYVNLESLSLINVGLTSLKNLPSLPNLKKLDLSDNHICDRLKIICEKAPHLTCLNLGGNYIKDFSAIQPLKNLKDLEILDMFNCDIQTEDDYRNKVFELLPMLKYLDGFDKEDREASDSEEMENEDENGDDEDDDGLDELEDGEEDDDEDGEEDELDDDDLDGEEDSESEDEHAKGDIDNKTKKGTKRKLEGDEDDDEDDD